MSSIFHVIEEEFGRLNEAMQAYSAAIEIEEQGSPQIKRVGLKDYLYLARRNGKKIKFRYIGNIEDENSRKVFDSIKKRREYEQLLKGVKSDIKEVRKVLRGRKI
jgi:hypothetical protein